MNESRKGWAAIGMAARSVALPDTPPRPAAHRQTQFEQTKPTDLPRIGPENADLQIVADTVRSQNTERIGMLSCEEAVQFVGRQAGDLERFHSYTLHR